MKIKEVIAQTGLTDRAIRLYIENGLITPETEKSYTGRRSFEFSESDVAMLGKIATLRKADFSLEQIKALQQGGEEAREALKAYLEDKQNAVTLGQKILAALADLPPQPQMEDICARIEDGLKAQPVPAADLKPGKWERFETWTLRLVSIGILLLWGLLAWGVELTYQEDFPFPHRYPVTEPIHYIGWAYLRIPLALAIGILLLSRTPRLNAAKQNRRRIAAWVMLALALLVMAQPMGSGALWLIPTVYSETSNPGDYMVLGDYVRMYGNDIHRLFPANIPRSAVAADSAWYPPDKFPETTLYYSYFEDCIDPNFEIYAQWILPVEEYRQELERISRYFPEGPTEQAQWGSWTVLSFGEDPLDELETLSNYEYILFAYHPQTKTVRYIFAYAMDERDGNLRFLQLDWR